MQVGLGERGRKIEQELDVQLHEASPEKSVGAQNLTGSAVAESRLI